MIMLKKRKINSLANVIDEHKNKILLRFLIEEKVLNEFIKASLDNFAKNKITSKKSAINFFSKRLHYYGDKKTGLSCFFYFKDYSNEKIKWVKINNKYEKFFEKEKSKQFS